MTVAARIEKDGVTIGRILTDFSVEWMPGGLEKSGGMAAVISDSIDSNLPGAMSCGSIALQVFELAQFTKNMPVRIVPEISPGYGADTDVIID